MSPPVPPAMGIVRGTAMSDLTARQVEAIAEVRAFAREHGVKIRPHDDFRIHFRPEARPGRGHDLDAFYADPDHAVAAIIDPYGSWRVSIGTVDWFHLDDGSGYGPDCTVCAETEEAGRG